MTQASDLGQIANQARTLYRGRVNAGFQAVATFHDGSSAPSPTYPNMLWFDTGTGTVKQRNPSNTSWNTLGTIGPPLTWTNVDVPPNELTTGDLKLTLKTSADSGWVMMNDTSIGDASSNATGRAAADCQSLFTLLWTNIINTWAPTQDSSGSPVSRGASAAADWAAHRRLLLPRTLGRALSTAGSGSGLTSRALGECLGEETHTLTGPEMAHNHPITGTNRAQGPAGGVSTFNSPTGAVSNVTASPHNIMQPASFLNVMVKL
jgi:hypothetical protein